MNEINVHEWRSQIWIHSPMSILKYVQIGTHLPYQETYTLTAQKKLLTTQCLYSQNKYHSYSTLWVSFALCWNVLWTELCSRRCFFFSYHFTSHNVLGFTHLVVSISHFFPIEQHSVMWKTLQFGCSFSCRRTFGCF